MQIIKIKALSVNEAYRGRRFSTQKLKDYKELLGYLLPKINVPDGKLSVSYIFGVSSKCGDGDNLVKAFQDSVAEQYGFNDRIIYEWYIRKEDVKKGDEYIGFEIKEYAPDTKKTKRTISK